MKIRNWCKHLASTMLAAGIYVPSMAYAVDVPLGDPSFEAFAVPALGYAYANAYRPTSAWVDDLDSPPGYTQDNAASSWLYNAAYAEDPTNARRASPRTGNQAMHGLANYSAQETTAVFEANKTYTFSIWAQGDSDGNATSSGVFMYLFDGTVPFSDANSLAGDLFTVGDGDFNNRGALDQAGSQANWRQISISHDVLAGAPEIGHPVGVGFFIRRDGAVDDATLDVSLTIPEPGSILLVGLGGVAMLACRKRR